MQKFLRTLMLAVLMLPFASQAQETLTVYDGTTTNSYVPAYMGYFDDFTRSQVVIPADSLAEMAGGSINSLTFYSNSSNVPYTSVSTVDVYLMEVSYTSISAYEPKSSATIVYSGTLSVVSANSGGEMTITFSTPYTYNGGNLLIGIDNTTDAGYTFIYFYGKTTSGASISGYNADETGPISVNQRDFIPKTTFTYEAADLSCYPVKKLAIIDSLTTAESLTFNWLDTNNSIASYKIYQIDGTDTTLIATVGDTSYTISQLDANTAYTFGVVSDCGNDGLGTMKIVSGRTACVAVTTFPWKEKFEDYAAGELAIPCWLNERIVDGTGNGSLSVFKIYTSTNGGNSTHQLQLPDMKAGTKTKLVLPLMEIPENEDYQFVIDVYRNASGSSATTEGVRVLANTTNDTTGATELAFLYRNFTQTDNNYIPAETASGWYTYELPIGMTGNVYIILLGESQYGNSTYMDNLMVRKTPTCLKVTGIAVVDSLATSSSITLTYSNEDGDDVVVINMADSSIVATSSDTLVTVDNLSPNTPYTFGVYRDCGGVDYSDTMFVSGRTACGAIDSLPYTTGFEADDLQGTANASALPWCWTRINELTTTYSYYPYSYSYSTYAHTGSRSLYFYSTSGDTYAEESGVILPELDVTAYPMNLNRLVFWARTSNTTNAYTVMVGTLSDAEDLTTFQLVGTVQVNSTTYAKYTVSLANADATDPYVVLLVTRTDGTSLYIDDVTLEVAPSCIEVSDVAIVEDMTTPNSLTLSWADNANSGATYTIYNMADTSVVATGIEDTFYTVSELTATTFYTFAVEANCGADGASPRVTVSGVTACDAILVDSENPYTEDFNSYADASTGTSAPAGYPNHTMPLCWDFLNMSATSGTYPQAFLTSSTTYSTTGNGLFFKSSSTTPLYAVMPEFESEGTMKLSFKYRNEGTSTSNGTLSVGILTDPADASTFTLLETYAQITSFTAKELLIADEMLTEGARIAFRYTGGTASNYYLAIEDVVFEQGPTCMPVTGLVASTITNESVTLTWDSVADGYVVLDMGDSSVVANVETNLAVIENLVSDTLYTFGVVSDCGGDGVSDTVVITVRTLCSAVAIPFTEDFEGTDLGCWTSEGQGTWTIGSGNHTSAVTTAYFGNTNAKINHSTNGNATKLISPVLAVDEDVTAVKLTFAHVQSAWGNDIDEHRVLYRTSAGGTWTEVADYTDAIPTWTVEEIMLPGNIYQVAFEFTDNYGYGVGIDSVAFEPMAADFCFSVAGMAIDSVDTNSVTVTWIGSANSYNLYIINTDSTGTDTTFVASVTDTFYTFTELTPATAYTFGVRAVCGNDSAELVTIDAHTTCVPMAIPYTEDFEDASTLGCWAVANIASGTGLAGSTYPYSGSYCFVFYYNTNPPQYLISPELSGTEDGVKVSFMYKVADDYYQESFQLGYSTTTNDLAAFTWGTEQTNLDNTDYEAYSEILPAGTKYVSIKYTANNMYALFIDSIVFDLPPNCMPVYNLAVDTATENSVTITWEGTADSYNVYIADSLVQENVTDNTYTFTGLEAFTAYTFGVRAFCGASDSADLATINATTDCEGGSCQIHIYAEDSYGDGWNGNTLTISQNGTVVATYTMADQGVSSTRIYDTLTVSVCKGVPVSFTYVLGGSYTYPSENSFTITDGTGEVVYTCTNGSTLTSGAVCFTLEDACPTCFPVTNLAVDTIGENSVTIKWDGDAANFSVYNGTTWVDNTADTFYTFTGLTANTLYTFGVRSVCAADDSSRMVTIEARTNCGTITELPYSTGFETADLMGTTDVLALPYCWTRNTSVATSTYPRSYSGYARNGSRSFVFVGSTGITAPDTMMVALPALDVTAYPMNANRVVFWARMEAASTSKNLYVGTMSDPTDRSTFVVVDSVLVNTNTYTKHSVMLTAATSPYVALMTKKVTGTIYIDDFKLEVAPDCADVEGLTIDSTDGTTVYVSWNDAQVSQYTVEARNGQTVAFTQTTSDTTLAITDLPIDNDYEIVVRSVCGAGNGIWSEPVTVHIGYCEPNPTSVDNSGITSVVFGGMTNTTSHPTSAPYYINNADMAGSVPAGTTANVDITFATGYTYGTIIWVDWNKNLVFDGDEVVYVGTSTSTNPTTLNASFLIPATQDTGAYRMRIGAADSYFDDYVSSIAAAATANPCWSSSFSVGEDYTLIVTEAPSFTVTANVNDAQMGHVIGAPTAPVLVGTEVNLVAAAEAGYHFVNWTSGATVISTTPTLDLTVTSDTTVTANFEANPVNTYTVTATVNNAQMGHITGAPTAPVTAGTVVNMTAVPETGYRFVNWTSGATVISTTAALALTVTSDTTVTANFELMPENPQYYTVTVNYDATKGTVTGIPTEPVLEGSSVRLTAEANEGYQFAGWVIANDTVGRELSYTISNIQSNVTITAVFVEKVGIDDIDMENVKVYSTNDVIYVNGAEGMSVSIFDVNGRILNQTEKAGENVEFRVAATGVYLVKVGNAAAKRVVVMR